ncbi:MAG TPA: carboxypeptidase M32 [Polyangiaceae bacterium]|nr:carboxypeptidase M32 [Polyangiaceae bacterium]
MSEHPDLLKLKTLLAEHSDLESAASLLRWDQATYMPPGGGAARGRQLATLDRLAHDRIADPEIGRLIGALEPSVEGDAAALVRVTRIDHERAVKVPAAFVSEFSNHRAASYEAWAKARPADDFASIAPVLEKTIELSRRYAEFFGPSEHVADPLIDLADPGMTVSVVSKLFAELRAELVPIVHAITSQPPADDSCLHKSFDETKQLDFGRMLAEKFGYDFSRGRQDKTRHPFMTKFSLDDVRITTRVRADDLSEALFSTLHEAGHALYEQNIDASLEASPLGHGTSAGVHESQSRLWENLVGRSRSFWTAFYPDLQRVFPSELGGVSLDTFYRAINKVERSLIRTNADEVTYGLHVILRFDFELALLEGKLRTRDLPEAWRERFRADFGIVPETDTDGVLQDVHWFDGFVGGAFQGYALGNLMSAQFFDAALRAKPQIAGELEHGRFDALRDWLTAAIYRHGRKLEPAELVQRATGAPLSIVPYVAYLRSKYGELYDI